MSAFRATEPPESVPNEGFPSSGMGCSEPDGALRSGKPAHSGPTAPPGPPGTGHSGLSPSVGSGGVAFAEPNDAVWRSGLWSAKRAVGCRNPALLSCGLADLRTCGLADLRTCGLAEIASLTRIVRISLHG